MKLFNKLKKWLTSPAPTGRQMIGMPPPDRKIEYLESIDETLKKIHEVLLNSNTKVITSDEIERLNNISLKNSNQFVPEIDTDGLTVKSDRTTKTKTVKRDFTSISKKIKEDTDE